jgi:hypothetical protein
MWELGYATYFTSLKYVNFRVDPPWMSPGLYKTTPRREGNCMAILRDWPHHDGLLAKFAAAQAKAELTNVAAETSLRDMRRMAVLERESGPLLRACFNRAFLGRS